MSKGWESKNVEQEQAATAERLNTAATHAAAGRDDATKKRHIQGLELQRERLLSERTSSPHRRSALEMAVATIERDLEQLGWSIKL